MRFGCRDLESSQGTRCLVIAEMGVNHNGDIGIAREMIDAAIEAGADVMKFQAFKSALEISKFAEQTAYQKGNAPGGGGQLELCLPLELSERDLLDLLAYCYSRGVAYLCAAFEDASLDFLLRAVKVHTIKIPSSEVTNLPFLRRVGASGVGVILSTGASTMSEVAVAVEALQHSGCGELMLFHCVSEYPAPLEQVNLRAMVTMRDAFRCAVGFSDHTVGVDAAIAATVLGASAIEKHFTLDKTLPGPDHRASIEPSELAVLVKSVRDAQACLGSGVKEPAPCEMANRPLIRKGLVAVRDLTAGTRIAVDMLAAKRPASGIEPDFARHLVGMRLLSPVLEDQPITWDMVRSP